MAREDGGQQHPILEFAPFAIVVMIGLAAFTLFNVGPTTPIQTQWNGVGEGSQTPAIIAVGVLPGIFFAIHTYISARLKNAPQAEQGRSLTGYAIVLIVCLGAQLWICGNALAWF